MRKFDRMPLDMLIRAFYHLLMKGEDIAWLDLLWLEQHAEKQAKRVREQTANLSSGLAPITPNRRWEYTQEDLAEPTS